MRRRGDNEAVINPAGYQAWAGAEESINLHYYSKHAIHREQTELLVSALRSSSTLSSAALWLLAGSTFYQ